MEELKELFGESAIDYATFESKCNEKGFKLADLSKGGYISKGKYDALSGEFSKYKQENDTSKYADYEEIKAERQKLLDEKAENELYSKITNAKVNERYKKFVLTEVKAMVDDKKDFDTCLTEYLKENEQFIESTDKQQFFKKSTSVDLTNGSTTQKNVNNKMNDIIRKGGK